MRPRSPGLRCVVLGGLSTNYWPSRELPDPTSAADRLGACLGAEVILLAERAAAADPADEHALARDGIAAGPHHHAELLADASPEGRILARQPEIVLARSAKARREGRLALGGLEGDEAAGVAAQEI